MHIFAQQIRLFRVVFQIIYNLLFKIWKPKQNVKGSTDLDEFDFEDYDEDELEETDDTGGGETEGEEI